MIIVTTLYNAEDYIERCIGSLMGQNYKDFTCYITDDMSTDKSVEKAKAMIGNDERFIIIENKEKFYQPGNYDQVIRGNDKVADDDVIVEVDGDDWLPDSKTLSRIAEVYSNPNIWIANGSFRYSNGAPGFASEQVITDNLRKSRFTASHMRTWRAFLWRNIKQEDLKNPEGVYWPVTGDLAFMFPMLEMAGQEHYKFMTDVNYIYNEENPLNDHKVDITLVNDIAVKIRNMEPYKRLEWVV